MTTQSSSTSLLNVQNNSLMQLVSLTIHGRHHSFIHVSKGRKSLNMNSYFHPSRRMCEMVAFVQLCTVLLICELERVRMQPVMAKFSTNIWRETMKSSVRAIHVLLRIEHGTCRIKVRCLIALVNLLCFVSQHSTFNTCQELHKIDLSAPFKWKRLSRMELRFIQHLTVFSQLHTSTLCSTKLMDPMYEELWVICRAE